MSDPGCSSVIGEAFLPDVCAFSTHLNEVLGHYLSFHRKGETIHDLLRWLGSECAWLLRWRTQVQSQSWPARFDWGEMQKALMCCAMSAQMKEPQAAEINLEPSTVASLLAHAILRDAKPQSLQFYPLFLCGDHVWGSVVACRAYFFPMWSSNEKSD